MDNYNKILNEIKADIQKDNVVNSENVISLYDLYYILKLKFEKLYSVIDKDKAFKSKIIFSRNLCKRAFFSLDSEKMLIHIQPTNNDNDSFSVSKQYNSDDLNFLSHTQSSKKYVKSFMNRYSDEVINAFSVIEEYKPILQALGDEINVPTESSIYGLNIRIIHLCEIVLSPVLTTKESLNYFNKDSIFEILDESKYELAKKISVNVAELNEILQNIVNDYYINRDNTYKKC